MGEPMVFGTTSCGWSCALLNKRSSPSLAVAYLANRAGVPWKETMNYDPRDFGQCEDGLHVFFESGDPMVDLPLGRYVVKLHVPYAKVVVTSNRAGHGAWGRDFILSGGGWAWESELLREVRGFLEVFLGRTK